jgi:hypothetical protein
MTDELHFRRTGGRLRLRQPAGDRRLFATVLRWDTPVKLSAGRGHSQEWFNRDRQPPLKPAVLSVLHGGRRAGQVIQWRSTVLGLDAVLLADESEVGAGLLELLDRHGTLPLSPSFLGDGTRHGTGVQWRSLSIPELAICAEGELPWCHCGGWPHEHGPGGRQPVWTCAGRRGGVPSYRMRCRRSACVRQDHVRRGCPALSSSFRAGHPPILGVNPGRIRGRAAATVTTCA